MNAEPIIGIKHNLGQFAQQLVQVFFVGMMIGMQRTILPLFAEQDFGLAKGSFLLLASFVISFGLVKAIMNFVAGRMSERFGRRQVLLWGWLVALPIPFLLAHAPHWSWIIAANILLGLNQGMCWSMTVTAKADISHAHERGLATGFNEFAGYGGVAIAGLGATYLADHFGVRQTLLDFGMAVVFIALLMAYFFTKETLPFAKAEAKSHKDKSFKGPMPRFPENLPATAKAKTIFTETSFHHPTFSALNQAGLVEKWVDALVWIFYPLYLTSMGLGLVEMGWVVGTYGLVWGACQLWTGPLSDRIGRKAPIVMGMWLAGIGVIMTVSVHGFTLWLLSAAITGFGMALLYPTLIAAVSDISHPAWRGTSLGIYRFWRDGGYAIGALVLGGIAQISDRMDSAFAITGLAMFISGLVVLVRAEETHPHINAVKD